LGVLKFLIVEVLLFLTASRRGGERGFCCNTLGLFTVVVAFRVASEGDRLRLVFLVRRICVAVMLALAVVLCGVA
jgi:hypothetical protein